jgi:hypothetical protein
VAAGNGGLTDPMTDRSETATIAAMEHSLAQLERRQLRRTGFVLIGAGTPFAAIGSVFLSSTHHLALIACTFALTFVGLLAAATGLFTVVEARCVRSLSNHLPSGH